MTSSPSILLILVCSVLLLTQLHDLQAATIDPPANCSSSCGHIRNISYPFRLTTDPPGCGDPGYELSCDPSNRTLLPFPSQNYIVKQIFYQNSTIRLVDPKLADLGCTLPSRSVSFEDVDSRFTRSWFHFSPPSVSFVNCSKSVSDPEYVRVPCLSTNGSGSVYVTYGGQTFSDLKPSCSFISMVLVLQKTPKNTSYEATEELLGAGFDLGWSVHCRDCRDSGGSCSSVTLVDDQLVYVCDRENYILTKVIPLVASILYTLLLALSLVLRFIGLPLVIVVFLIHKYATTRKKVDTVEQFLRNQESSTPKRYSYTDITAITNHFRDKLGQGGFGSVYKGQLPGGCFIAVKMLSASSSFTGDDFINEVSTIGRTHHRNVVELIGFCSGGSHRALVYEYMPNGSLDKHIFSPNGKGHFFSWEKLLEIAVGAARGVNYLHEGCDVCILHFDIKPHNVLLDDENVPKIADFGLAKFYPKERDIVSVSTTRGTIGYIAPELISKHFGAVSTKTDVYSFGMVLLEMAGGRRNVDTREERSSRVYFPSWVYDRLSFGEDMGLADVTEDESRIARKLCVVGLWCIQMKSADRPSMSRVVEMLEGRFEDLKMPPKPGFSTPKYMSMRDSWPGSSGELISESVEESLYMNRSNDGITSQTLEIDRNDDVTSQTLEIDQNRSDLESQ